MLEPDSRILLLDALRPPSGYTLDLAVGTTYSLDLLALMIAPVAFAMFERQASDGSLIEDPIATLQALREHAARISIFCQAGQIAVPPEFRALLVYLEGSVHPVVPPDPTAIFHPKVWYLRFRERESDAVAYRLLCLSRNLTFDRSWDTILRLDGRPDGVEKWGELERFASSLVSMAEKTSPVSKERASAIRELGKQFAWAEWTLPDGFESVKFWPLGDDAVERWPFEGHRRPFLVVSPFVSSELLSRLTKASRGSILVTRPETLDSLGGNSTAHLLERLILSSDASSNGGEVSQSFESETAAESAERRLDGLHAKTYIADAGWKTHVWSGSANATDAAFNGNVEFLVELVGRKESCGIHATIGDRSDRLGLRKLLIPYDPVLPEPVDMTDAEKIGLRLERARRAIGGLRFTATCAGGEGGYWSLSLSGLTAATRLDGGVLEGVSTSIRPITLGKAATTLLEILPSGMEVEFNVSEAAVTPFFALTVAIEEMEIAFLVAAELVDPPPGRAERVLSSLLANRSDLIRFLLLLLGNVEDALAAFDGVPDGSKTKGNWLAGHASEALFEPLVHAFSRDPERLRDIERVMNELRRSAEGSSILPERWNEIWDPIADALEEMSL